jgi:hypothetical protein
MLSRGASFESEAEQRDEERRMSDNPEQEAEAADIRKTSETDQGRAEQGEWTDCWICADVFRRRMQTKRYCAKCHRGFCEGWHGSLDRGYGTCIICWADTDAG